jgi:hypothetical protein
MTQVSQVKFVTIRSGQQQQPRPPFVLHGVSLAQTGGVIISARWVDGFPTVVALERYPSRLSDIGQAVRDIAPDEFVLIDGGLHGADLWHFLGYRHSKRHRHLFEVARPELRRAELAGRLRAAYELEAFAIKPSLFGLGNERALRDAIAQSGRDDAADRPEVAALSLAVIDRRPAPPRIY